ncbi:HEAT repeat domain-containing protein [Coleofasciculus sp. FACHB-1120]|uniref:HEAT repeat domain-containing protein n=1 Tax=Coleofasciculus sp. FACHB-1120 TaxID=2692783 RepID=UPI001689B9F4|nr:HEAT repeat domain-containing protein [Coleofasciculus sp. FACHB-1120]MBD2740849.1 HEAT repeat domain-containing protein [Coleofasciculus sp. FACHB-1120]
MLYRSTLLLVTWVICLGFTPNSGKNSTGFPLAIATSPPSFPVSLKLAQSSSPAANKNLPLLTVGSQGVEVAELQKSLKSLGHYNGAVDGAYGRTTAVAVSKFQTSVGLTPDGVAGSTTQERIQAAEAAKSSPAPTPKPKAAKASSGANRLWWLLGLTAASAGVGLGVYFLLKWLGNLNREEELEPESDELADERSYEDPKDANHPADIHAHPIENENGNNGYHASALTFSETSNLEKSNLDGRTTSQKSTEGVSEAKPLARLRSNEAKAIGETTRLPKIDIVNELIKDLQGADPTKRRKAIWELAQCGDSRAIQPLVDLMIDSDSQQRGLILEALSQIGTRTLKPMNRALAISLQDENPDVRKNAIRDLTRIYDTIGQVSNLLRHAAEDRDSEVQETARWAIGQLNRLRLNPGTDNNLPALPNSQNSSNHPPEESENR